MLLNLKFPATPEYATKHAELMVPLAKDVSGVLLDFTPDSLARVDSIIASFRADGVHVDQIAETLFCFGCYVGEVFVRHSGGTWRHTAETSMARWSASPLIVQLGPDHFCNPIDKVFKRFENGEEDSLPYFFGIFGARATS